MLGIKVGLLVLDEVHPGFGTGPPSWSSSWGVMPNLTPFYANDVKMSYGSLILLQGMRAFGLF